MSAIAEKHHQIGMEFLGNPISQERACQDGRGRYRHYEGGSILWHPDVGAHEVHGAILQKWKAHNWERGFLGYPLTDELSTPDGIGRYNHFQHGSIYWFPTTGAYEVHGAIRSDWARRGWERSFLRYPETDELSSPDGVRYSRFQGGYLVWTPESGVKVFAEGLNKDRTDEALNFGRLGDTYYGNLHEFCGKMNEWYGIDLREGMIRKGTDREKCIFGWPFADFEKSHELNGYTLSSGERLILTAATILLMQWCLRDLRNNGTARRDQIDKYCGGCFKRNYVGKWHYNKWCSEFVSYVYKRSGNALKIRYSQSYMCENLWKVKKDDWCGRTVSTLRRHFESIGRYRDMATFRQSRVPPQAGDYLRTWGHSMMVLGFDREERKIYVIEGNTGPGPTQDSGRRVKVGWRDINDSSLVGIGQSPVHISLVR